MSALIFVILPIVVHEMLLIHNVAHMLYIISDVTTIFDLFHSRWTTLSDFSVSLQFHGGKSI